MYAFSVALLLICGLSEASQGPSQLQLPPPHHRRFKLFLPPPGHHNKYPFPLIVSTNSLLNITQSKSFRYVTLCQSITRRTVRLLSPPKASPTFHHNSVQVDTAVGNNGVRITHSGSLPNRQKAHKVVLIS